MDDDLTPAAGREAAPADLARLVCEVVRHASPESVSHLRRAVAEQVELDVRALVQAASLLWHHSDQEADREDAAQLAESAYGPGWRRTERMCECWADYLAAHPGDLERVAALVAGLTGEPPRDISLELTRRGNRARVLGALHNSDIPWLDVDLLIRSFGVIADPRPEVWRLVSAGGACLRVPRSMALTLELPELPDCRIVYVPALDAAGYTLAT